MFSLPSTHRGARERFRSGEIDRLVDQNGRLRSEVVRLGTELARARSELSAKDAEIEKLSAEVAHLGYQLDEARRAGKRRAAPFSKGNRIPPALGKRPGRKAGTAYGTKARLLPPKTQTTKKRTHAAKRARSHRDFEALKRRRLRAAEMFRRGRTQAQVTRALGVSAQSVSRWYQAWSSGGTTALRGTSRAGRLPRLSDEHLAEVVTAVVH
jgi:hypothetical protein